MVKTHRQVKVVEKTLETLKTNKPLSKGKIIEACGYSESAINNPQQVYKTEYVKNELDKVVNTLKDKRDIVLNSLTKGKINKEKAKDLVGMTDVLTKNIELLSGNATERESMVLDEDQKKGIAQELLKRISITN